MHVNGNPECNHYSAKQSPTYERKGTFSGYVMHLTHQGFYLSHFTWLEEHYYPKRSLPTYSWATERSWIIFLHKMILVHLSCLKMRTQQVFVELELFPNLVLFVLICIDPTCSENSRFNIVLGEKPLFSGLIMEVLAFFSSALSYNEVMMHLLSYFLAERVCGSPS